MLVRNDAHFLITCVQEGRVAFGVIHFIYNTHVLVSYIPRPSQGFIQRRRGGGGGPWHSLHTVSHTTIEICSLAPTYSFLPLLSPSPTPPSLFTFPRWVCRAVVGSRRSQSRLVDTPSGVEARLWSVRPWMGDSHHTCASILPSHAYKVFHLIMCTGRNKATIS